MASASISESLTVRPRALTLTLAAGLVLVYVPVVDHAVGVWRYDQELTFGFLVPPFTLALLWLRRSSLRNAVSAGDDLGLVLFVGGLGLLVTASRMGVHALAGASFLPTVLGATAYLFGAGVALRQREHEHHSQHIGRQDDRKDERNKCCPARQRGPNGPDEREAQAKQSKQ